MNQMDGRYQIETKSPVAYLTMEDDAGHFVNRSPVSAQNIIFDDKGPEVSSFTSSDRNDTPRKSKVFGNVFLYLGTDLAACGFVACWSFSCAITAS